MSPVTTFFTPVSEDAPVKNTFIHFAEDDLPEELPVKRAQSCPSTSASCAAAVCCCIRTPGSIAGIDDSTDAWDVESQASFASTASAGELVGWSTDGQQTLESEIAMATSVCQKSCQQAKAILLVPYVWLCQNTVVAQQPDFGFFSPQKTFQPPEQLNMPFMSVEAVDELPCPQGMVDTFPRTSMEAPPPELMDTHLQAHAERVDADGAKPQKKRAADVTLFKHREEVGLEDSCCAEGFHLLKRLIGPSGQYMKRIAEKSSGAKVWVSGRGSCRAADHSRCQKGKDCTGSLAVCISALSETSHDAAVDLVKELLERVRADHARYHRKYSDSVGCDAKE